MKQLTLFIAILSCGLIGFSQSDSTITSFSSRNGFTPVTKTLPKGKVLIDLGISVDKSTIESEMDKDWDRKLWSFPALHVGVGISKRLGLFADYKLCHSEALLPDYWSSIDIWKQPTFEYGYLGNYQLGAKYFITEHKKWIPEMMIQGSLQGQYSHKGDGVNHEELMPYAEMAFNYYVGKYFQFGGSFFTVRNPERFPFSATMRVTPSNKFGLVASYTTHSTKYNPYSNVINHGNHVVDFGLYARVFKKMRVDFHWIPELDRYPPVGGLKPLVSDEFHFTFGISALF